MPRIVYCNSVLVGLTSSTISPLQLARNAPARLTVCLSMFLSVCCYYCFLFIVVFTYSALYLQECLINLLVTRLLSALFHDLLLRSYLYRCVCSVITAHNLTPEKRDNNYSPLRAFETTFNCL